MAKICRSVHHIKSIYFCHCYLLIYLFITTIHGSLARICYLLQDERFKLDKVVEVTNAPVDGDVQVGALNRLDEQNMRSNLQNKKWFSVSTKVIWATACLLFS